MGKGEVEIGGPLSLAPGWVMRTWHGAVAATLKHKLVAGTAEMRRLKDRVQRLQNELIRVWILAGVGRGCPRDGMGWEQGGAGRQQGEHHNTPIAKQVPERPRTPTMRLSQPYK